MNKIFLLGNATKDAELITTQNGTTVCKFGIAVQRRFSKDEVDFFNITTFKALAENCAKFIKKGNKVAIVGSVRINEYKANDGSTKVYVDILADEVQFLTPKTEKAQQQIQQDMFTPVDDSEQLPF